LSPLVIHGGFGLCHEAGDGDATEISGESHKAKECEKEPAKWFQQIHDSLDKFLSGINNQPRVLLFNASLCLVRLETDADAGGMFRFMFAIDENTQIWRTTVASEKRQQRENNASQEGRRSGFPARMR
jgi:hypothetical protein